MNTDSAFTIGKTHEVCQDYALNFSEEGQSAIVLCDGCSSSKMSDIGARLLALSAIKSVRYGTEPKYMLDHVVVNLLKCGEMGLIADNTMLDSTVLLGWTEFDTFYIVVRGDGVIVKEWNDNRVTIIDITQPSGYPFYLSYDLYPERMAGFREKDEGTVINYHQISPELSHSTESYDKSEQQIFVFSTKNYKRITFLSDGIHSFQKRNETDTSLNYESVNFLNVIKELISFKNCKGKFVQRRLNKFKKTCEANRWFYSDDLSMATINFES